jgi:hypothetical protein
MGSFTDYGAGAILDHVFKIGAMPVPTNLYVGLSTTTPTDAGGNITEPSGNAYARTVCNGWTRSGTAPTQVQNTAAVTFPTATGSWGTLTHFFIADHVSAGNIICWGALGASQAIALNDIAQYAANALTVTQD